MLLLCVLLMHNGEWFWCPGRSKSRQALSEGA